ncbi:MAG: bifunctional metallophosphatase/5'-nucleotidase [Butyrivibrio sp.]|nr:bifunctional metallophosphatase/5'-nucleotidase [Butyrivibrio sp.]
MKKLSIYYTSDTHGHIFPVNYGTDSPENSGLLNIAGEIKKDDNTLVLDGGDSLQGTPLTQYYLSRSMQYDFHPVAEGFNAMGCDFFTLGNHDFNFGYDVIRDYLRAMKGTCVCANVEDLRGELQFQKSAVKVLGNGLKIGISGAVTEFVNVWEQKEHLTELKVTDPYEAAKKALEELKKENCDFYILIYHGGFEEEPATGRKLSQTRENLGCLIGRELGYDILLTGHQHIANEKFMLDGTFAVQPPANAARYIYMDICKRDAEDREVLENYEKCGKNTELYVASKLVATGNTHKEEPYNKMLSMEEDIQKWLDEPIGELTEAILPEEKMDVALYGSKIAAIFNQVQLEFSGADFSCTSLGNEPLGLAKPITIRDICRIYTFSNTVMVLEVTGQTLKNSLERVASYFILDEKGEPGVSEEFLKPKLEHYNYDFYANMDYEFDLRNPVGERVVKMQKLDGSAIDMEKKYTLVTSNYRATGTGGYTDIGNSEIIRNSTEEMPDLLQDFVRKHTPLSDIHNSKLKVTW